MMANGLEVQVPVIDKKEWFQGAVREILHEFVTKKLGTNPTADVIKQCVDKLHAVTCNKTNSRSNLQYVNDAVGAVRTFLRSELRRAGFSETEAWLVCNHATPPQGRTIPTIDYTILFEIL